MSGWYYTPAIQGPSVDTRRRGQMQMGTDLVRLLAVRLLDLALGARLLDLEDLVKGRGLAAADAEDGGGLLGRVLALLVALVVLAAAGGAAI